MIRRLHKKKYFPAARVVLFYLTRPTGNDFLLKGGLRQQYTPLGHNTNCRPKDLGQYNSLGVYCDPHTVSSVFLIFISQLGMHPMHQKLTSALVNWVSRERPVLSELYR